MWYKFAIGNPLLRGATSFLNGKHAQAVLNAAYGRMEAVDPQTFADQIRKNRYSATLSGYSPEELAQKKLFKLRDAHIYYAMTPIGKHPITGKPENDIVSVMNNNADAPGVAADAVMLHALENNGSTLDCWDVNGYLPSLYERFGFEEIGRGKYDVNEYGQPSPALVQQWKNSGWDKTQPYPDVVYMKYGGIEGDGRAPDRQTVRANYLRTGSIHGTGNPVMGQLPGERILQPDDSGNQAAGSGWCGGEARSPSEVRDPADTGRAISRTGGFKGHFHAAYSALHNASDEDLTAMGISPNDVRTLPLPYAEAMT